MLKNLQNSEFKEENEREEDDKGELVIACNDEIEEIDTQDTCVKNELIEESLPESFPAKFMKTNDGTRRATELS